MLVKYILKAKKNGILLISDLKKIDDSDYNIKNNIKFYNTKDFEVHCFCQISKIVNKNLLKDSEIDKTNYFFVGGFDTKRYRGGIKLYKINENKEEIIEIEKIQDIELENEYLQYKKDKQDKQDKQDNKDKQDNQDNKDKDILYKLKLFKGPISCIKQSTYNGNILITCWDGNVYLFNAPDIEKLISLEKNIDFILKEY